MNAQVEAAIAEIRQGFTTSRQDNPHCSTWEADFVEEVLRRHFAEPDPLVAKLEALAANWMARADRNDAAEKHMVAGAIDDCADQLRRLIEEAKGGVAGRQ